MNGIGVLWNLRSILNEETLRMMHYCTYSNIIWYYYLGKNL